MTSISIPLSDEQLLQLEAAAEQAGLPADEFLRQNVETLLSRPDDKFYETAEYLLKKNAELYRRLA